MTLDQLKAELRSAGLTSEQIAAVLPPIREYGAHLIQAHARTPRSQQDSDRRVS